MNVLIIKTGHTETFDPLINSSHIVSLGDVLRTTVLLHLFKNDEVTWLTSHEALPLLKNNPFIARLAVETCEIDSQKFDLIINLERTGISRAFSKKLFVGFDQGGALVTTQGTFLLIDWMNNPEILVLNWSQKLFLLLGKTWHNENYVLIPERNIEPIYDLGLNWKVGPKWPSKSWSFANWEEIYHRVKNDWSVSFQEGFHSIPEYISWIQSCRSLLTHDSLGLHIGLALGKPMTALFGPTLSLEIPLEKTRVLSLSEDPRFQCPPCYQELCRSKIHCVGALSLELVEREVINCLRDEDGEFTIRRKQALTSS